MENATKALLIAGSVLIVILLIAMGMKIFNSTSETTEQSEATMDATTITQFNNQFVPYLNKNLTLTQAQSLYQKIMASNAVNSTHKVKYKGAVPNGSETVEAKTYTADYENGYISNIK